MNQNCEVPFTMNCGVMVIRASIECRQRSQQLLNFVVDTGATISILNQNSAILCGYTPAQKSANLSISNSKGLQSGYKIKVPEFIVGKIKIKDMTFGVLGLPHSSAYQGIIGLDILKNFELLIDFKKQKLTFSQVVLATQEKGRLFTA